MTPGTYDMKATTGYVWKIMQPVSLSLCSGVYNEYEGNCFGMVPAGASPIEIWSSYGSTICPVLSGGKSTVRLAEFYTLSSQDLFKIYYSIFEVFYVGGKRSAVSGQFEWFTTGQVIDWPITNGPSPGDCLYYHQGQGLKTIDCNLALGSLPFTPAGAACETF